MANTAASLIDRTRTFGRMIKFSHSVFALPFAFVAGLVAWVTQDVALSPLDVGLLLVCMISARTAAMGFNRIADRDIDAINPRTRSRELPTGMVRLTEARVFTTIASLAFVAAAFVVNPLCGALAVPVLALLLGYSYTKRVTLLAHFVLGACLGVAPVAVWFALTGTFSWVPVLLGLGVTMWTAGFDIYYSLQDEAFDREQGLQSIPARLGTRRSIALVRPIHAVAVACYVGFGILSGMGPVFFVGVAAVAGILIYEAWLLRTGDLGRINLAFFNLNGYVSVLFAAASVADVALR